MNCPKCHEPLPHYFTTDAGLVVIVCGKCGCKVTVDPVKTMQYESYIKSIQLPKDGEVE